MICLHVRLFPLVLSRLSRFSQDSYRVAARILYPLNNACVGAFQ